MHTILDNREGKYLVPQPLGGGVYTVVAFKILDGILRGLATVPPVKIRATRDGFSCLKLRKGCLGNSFLGPTHSHK